MESCAKEIYSWMACNKIKLNHDKTEFLVIHAKHRTRPPIVGITITDVSITSTLSARNIGVAFNDVIDLEQHVNSICRAAFFHISNLSKIRNCLTQEDTETLVHAFITFITGKAHYKYIYNNKLRLYLYKVARNSHRLINLWP